MTDNADRANFGWGFWLVWVIASTIGLVVGLLVYYFVFLFFFAGPGSAGAGGLGGTGIAIFTVSGAVLGASLGFAQWLVLRSRTPQPGQWIRETIYGGAAGGSVAMIVGEAVAKLLVGGTFGRGFLISLIVSGLVIGTSVGIAQWLMLRRQVSRAGWWVLASAVGFVVAVVGAFQLVPIAGYGIITGAIFVWLLRQRDTEEPSIPQDAT